MGGEREQLESVEEILIGDEGELLILGEELLEEGEEEGETWISRTLVGKNRVKNISKFSSLIPGSSVFPGYLVQKPFCTAPAHMENLVAAS